MLKPSRLKAGFRPAPAVATATATRSSGGARLPLVEQEVVAQHFPPPSPRELRAQVVQRLQMGLFGLVTMLLLVGLADIIMQHARALDGMPGIAASPRSAASAGMGSADPLADIGVAPSPEATAATRRPASHSGNR